MSFRELGGRYIVCIACSLYLTQSYFNCTVVSFFLFLTIVTLCRLLQLLYFQNLWSEHMPDLLLMCVIKLVLLRLLWQNTVTVIQLFKYVYKILHHLVPTYLQDMFMFSENVTGYVGRNSHRLFVPRMQTIYEQKSLFYRRAVAWNNIDQTLYSATSLKTFKLSYKLLYS